MERVILLLLMLSQPDTRQQLLLPLSCHLMSIRLDECVILVIGSCDRKQFPRFCSPRRTACICLFHFCCGCPGQGTLS
jgi:hypothetical protein